MIGIIGCLNKEKKITCTRLYMNVKKCCEDPKYRKGKRGDDINVSVLFCPDDAIVCRNYFNFIRLSGPSGSPNGGRI